MSVFAMTKLTIIATNKPKPTKPWWTLLGFVMKRMLGSISKGILYLNPHQPARHVEGCARRHGLPKDLHKTPMVSAGLKIVTGETTAQHVSSKGEGKHISTQWQNGVAIPTEICHGGVVKGEQTHRCHRKGGLGTHTGGRISVPMATHPT